MEVEFTFETMYHNIESASIQQLLQLSCPQTLRSKIVESSLLIFISKGAESFNLERAIWIDLLQTVPNSLSLDNG
jgi:hypothetical protein